LSTDLCELAPSCIRSIAPYQPGKPIGELARELGIANIVKLASNENPRGPSPLALRAIADALPDLALYPDGGGYDLKTAIAEKFSVNRDQIVLGNGSNDVLELAARAFLTAGTSAVYSQHAFIVYPLVTQATGARGIVVPAKDYGHDLDAMARAIRADTRIVFIANPNNPTGTFVPSEQLLGFLRAVPDDVLVVLDEAYTEYLPDKIKPPGPRWLPEFPNLLITRTFSKAYGLAGLRVGFGLVRPEIADLMDRIRQPFNVNYLALIGATAALHDEDFVRASFALNQRGLRQLTAGFERLGLSYIPSYGNFISVRVGNAGAVYQHLLREGVIVRPIAGYGMPEHLRVTVGLEEENERFLRALQCALAALR
jgi:histidinol-phosphate aminotransferase